MSSNKPGQAVQASVCLGTDIYQNLSKLTSLGFKNLALILNMEEAVMAIPISTVVLMISRKWEGVVRTGWSWLRIGTGGGHL